jgi:hypothetical protein
MTCSCIVAFLLTLSGGVGHIAPQSFTWEPSQCLVGAMVGAKPGYLVIEKQYYDGKISVMLPLPPKELSGDFTYRYCWGNALVTVNGYQRAVVVDVIEQQVG